MKVLIFGATGMVGAGVLLECLSAADVEAVVAVGRSPVPLKHPKLRQVAHADLFHLADIEAQLQPFDACFFCLGVSSVGMQEAEYSRLTYELTLGVATVLARLNRTMTFVYVSGASTDSSEQGRTMWARVKGRTENSLQRVPFKAVYLFRPGAIRPVKGVRSKTPIYQTIYVVLGPLLALVGAVAPNAILTTEGVGLAMLDVARRGARNAVLEASDLKDIVRRLRKT